MKRDLDLCRQLLADIEGHGPDCAVTALRPGVTGEADEQVRYHVRLLIDAGLAKEVDRTIGGVPCVRLTNDGHEFLELAHSESRWREAKWVVGERTGGQSLAVIRSVLTRWAYEASTHGERWRPRRYTPVGYTRRPAAYNGYRTAYHRVEPRYRFERDVEPLDTRLANGHVAAGRPPYGGYLERFDWRSPVDWRDAAERDTYYRDGLFRDGYYGDAAWRAGEPLDLDGLSLPTHVV